MRGAGVYSDPDGSEWIAAAHASEVILLRDNAQPQRIPVTYQPGDEAVIDMEFCQAFGNLLCFRGFDLEPLIWDGDPARPFYP
ncbi:hypothetical protein ACG94V_21950, partial [Acinetobacter sp. ULE_I001]|uniref:hypothetical protein n=1 Tax=Acinetobacter sp. ULE_I001 TaxID=3373064 RepID=UPI003AF759FF